MLQLLEGIKSRDNQPLAEQVMAKNTKVPKTIYIFSDPTGKSWTSGGRGVAWGTAEKSAIHVGIRFDPYFISPLAGVPTPSSVSDYAFTITFFRQSEDANPNPIDIKVARIELKINGRTYLPKTRPNLEELNDGCSCGKFYSEVQFFRAGPIGKEPFEIILTGISDAGTKFAPLTFKTDAIPSGLIRANPVLSEIIVAQWTR